MLLRRQVGEHRRSRQRAVGAGRDRRPQVLADLDVQHEAGQVAAREHELRPARDRAARHRHLVADQVARGAELALLVVLVVLGQIALGHDAEHPPAWIDDRALNSPPSARTGAPTTITGRSVRARRDDLRSACSPRRAARSGGTGPRSSRPVSPSSGKHDAPAPSSAARRPARPSARRCSSGSPTRTWGTAAATRTNPWA